jgi:hypothetical protein
VVDGEPIELRARANQKLCGTNADSRERAVSVMPVRTVREFASALLEDDSEQVVDNKLQYYQALMMRG